MFSKVIAIDFDGCLVENQWPDIGRPNLEVFARALDEKKAGAAVILWTCRTGPALDEAVSYCRKRGLVFDAVNDNIPEMVEHYGGSNCRKVVADEYWDDHAVQVPRPPIQEALAVWRESRRHVTAMLGVCEVLAALAEEASELAQAALKLRRALNGKNPTPVSPEDATQHLHEELADVLLCASSLSTSSLGISPDAIALTLHRKSSRWYTRVTGRLACPGTAID